MISSTPTLKTSIPTLMHEAESGGGGRKKSNIVELEVIRHLKVWQVEGVAE